MSILTHQIAQRFAKAQTSYTQHACIQHAMSVHLMQLMQHYCGQSQWQRILELGCGTGNLTQQLQEHWQIRQLFLNDLYPSNLPVHTEKGSVTWCLGDMETISFPAPLEMITASSAVQWVQHVDAFVDKVAKALQPRGYFCFSSFGPQNFKQIKQLTGFGLNYLSLEQWLELLQMHGFDIVYHEQQTQSLWFSHPYNILKHLKATGVTATAQNYQWNKTTLQKFYDDYQQFSVLNQQQRSYELLYHPLFVLARKK